MAAKPKPTALGGSDQKKELNENTAEARNPLAEQDPHVISEESMDEQVEATEVVEQPEIQVDTEVEVLADTAMEIAEEPVLEDAVEEEVEDKVQAEPRAKRGKKVKEIIEDEIAPETADEPVKDPGSELLVEEVITAVADDEEEVEHHDEVEEIPDYAAMSKEQLVMALEEIVKSDEINSIKHKVSLIRLAYNDVIRAEHLIVVTSDQEVDEATVTVKEEDKLNIRFDAAFGIYKQKKHRQDEDLELQKQRNLEAKNSILEELRSLISSEESLKKTYDEFRDLQQKWKEIGIVPRNEVANLWQNYHFLVEKFFDKVRINKELRDLDLRKNLEEKISLCEKAEELLLDSSITRSFKLLQHYHNQWKEIGPVPQESRDEIWERFKSASEKINKRRRDFYVEAKEDQENNLAAKYALCDKIEDLLLSDNKSVGDWNARSNEVKEMFDLWKAIGQGPKKENDAAWERFKSAVDRFYADKSEYFGKIKEEQLENYNRKLDICVQAEALKDSTDWKGTSNSLIKLQQEWKSLGPVSRKNADKIWKRFRTACDEFFQRKNEYFVNIKGHEQENLSKKQELINRVNTFEFGKDKSENLKLLKEFQREWIEIGHVPMKDKDTIQAEFRKAIDQRMEDLQISSTEIAEMNYRSRLERIMDAPDASRILSKERIALQGRITGMQNEINLWENNLGFLASSKKADLLKAEFETKIQKAKEEVALMKAQLKLLKDR